jgi:membrane dipeptidase
MANGPGGGPSGAGEPTNERVAGRDTGFYEVLVSAMLKVGFTSEEIGKVGGGNFCRVFEPPPQVTNVPLRTVPR